MNQVQRFLMIFYFLLLTTLSLVGLTAAATEAVVADKCTDCGDASANGADIKSILDKIQKNESLSCENKSSRDCFLTRWLVQKNSTYAKNCKGFFVDDKGHLGNYSRTVEIPIMKDIGEDPQNSVFTKNNPDFDNLCPGFKKMTPLQKAAFHGWVFELTAFPESACNLNVPANNAANVPNGPAVCLYQLELSPSLRAWRSAGFKQKNCAVSAFAIETLEGCTGCALDEYKRHILANGSPFGRISTDGKLIHKAYWASHNPLSDTQKACMENSTRA